MVDSVSQNIDEETMAAFERLYDGVHLDDMASSAQEVTNDLSLFESMINSEAEL